MKFENIRNFVEPSINDVDLTEKEIEFISMLRLGVDFNKYKDVFSMSIAEENKLYRKFGVPEFYKNRERFVLAVSLTNNIVPYETLKTVCEKYSLKGYDKMLEAIKNAPKYSDKYFEETNEALISLCEKINEMFKQ